MSPLLAMGLETKISLLEARKCPGESKTRVSLVCVCGYVSVNVGAWSCMYFIE